MRESGEDKTHYYRADSSRERGFVNGNNKGMTNGVTNGITNGLTNGVSMNTPNSTRLSRERHIKKFRKIRNSLLFSILLLSLITLPISGIHMFDKQTQKKIISVDGNFNDWSRAYDKGYFTYLSDDTNIDSNIDIINTAVLINEDWTNFYVKTKNNMFTEPTDMYIFLDYDMDYDTGYKFYDIGTDYIIHVAGDYGTTHTVKSGNYFDSDNNYNWNNWHTTASNSVSVLSCGNELEAQIYGLDIGYMTTLNIYVVMKDDNGDMDTSGLMTTCGYRGIYNENVELPTMYGRVIIDGLFNEWKRMKKYDNEHLVGKYAYMERTVSFYVEEKKDMMMMGDIPKNPKKRSEVLAVNEDSDDPPILGGDGGNRKVVDIRTSKPVVTGEDTLKIQFTDNDRVHIKGMYGMITYSCYERKTDNVWVSIKTINTAIVTNKLETQVAALGICPQFVSYNMTNWDFSKYYQLSVDAIDVLYELSPRNLFGTSHRNIEDTRASTVSEGHNNKFYNATSGEWEDINLTIVDNSPTDSGFEYYAYKNMANYFKTYFKMNQSENCTIAFNDYMNGEYVLYQQVEDMYLNTTNGRSRAGDNNANQNGVANGKKVGWTRFYAKDSPTTANVSIEYEIFTDKLKANYTLEHKVLGGNPNNGFFEIVINLTWVGELTLWWNDTINITDTNYDGYGDIHFKALDTNRTTFYIPEANATDDNGVVTGVQYQILDKLQDRNLSVIIRTPYPWLMDAGRAYPVLIDPTVVNIANANIYATEPQRLVCRDSAGYYYAVYGSSGYSRIVRSTNVNDHTAWESSRVIIGVAGALIHSGISTYNTQHQFVIDDNDKAHFIFVNYSDGNNIHHSGCDNLANWDQASAWINMSGGQGSESIGVDTDGDHEPDYLSMDYNSSTNGIHIAFREEVGGDKDDLFHVCYNGTDWSTPIKLSDGDVDDIRLIIDSSDNINIVYSIIAPADLFYMRSEDGGQSFGTLADPTNGNADTITADFGISGYPDAAIMVNSTGDIMVAWTNHSYILPASSEVGIHYRTSSGTSWNTPGVVIYEYDRINSYPFLLIDGAGTWYCIYIDRTGDDTIHYKKYTTSWGAEQDLDITASKEFDYANFEFKVGIYKTDAIVFYYNDTDNTVMAEEITIVPVPEFQDIVIILIAIPVIVLTIRRRRKK